MRSRYWLPLLASAMLVVGSAPIGATASNKGSCLRAHNLDRLTTVVEGTLLAKSRTGKHYTVALKGACPSLRKPSRHYTVRFGSRWDCFDHDDVLVFNDGTLCFIASVTERH